MAPTRTPSGTSTRPGRVSYSGGEQVGGAEAIALALGGAGAEAAQPRPTRTASSTRPSSPAHAVEQRRVSEDEQIGRNDPCWCGSGKKFKKCHGATSVGARPRGVTPLRLAWVNGPGSAPESTPQRLAAIREQLSLLSDYL